MESSGAAESMAPFVLGGEERILSIMLSTSELAKLDLSNIQLFQANVDCAQNGLNEPEKQIDPLFLTRQDSFSFPLEAEEEGFCTAPVQFLKSRGVLEAEKSMMEENKGNNNGGRKKSVSMDETRLDRFESRRKENQENQESRDVAEEKKIKKAQDDSALHDTPRPQPLPVKNGRAEEERAEAEEKKRIKSSIDLKSSPAAKFLVQVMPWELQPSPVTPFTPAAVPFKWEEVPGKPKGLHEPNGLPPQSNSFPVLHPPPRLLMPPLVTKKLPAPQSQSGAQHSRSSSGSCSAEEKRVISVETESLKETPGSVISSLDYKLPSPWNGDVKPAYSPFRDLGPPENAVRKLRKKAASSFISVWRKSSPKKDKPKPDSAPPVSSCGGGELLMDREALWMEVNENIPTNVSLNARIAVAMGSDNDEGFSNKTMMCSWDAKDLRPIPDSEYYNNGLRVGKKRPRRKWVLRKLRRPARFFRAFFNAVWRVVSLRKSRDRKRENIKLSYQSLAR